MVSFWHEPREEWASQPLPSILPLPAPGKAETCSWLMLMNRQLQQISPLSEPNGP